MNLGAPQNGARITLTLGEADDAHATYALEIETTGDTHRGTGTLRLQDSAVDFVIPEAVEPWVTEFIRGLLHSVLQDRKQGPSWPRRVHRWRQAR